VNPPVSTTTLALVVAAVIAAAQALGAGEGAAQPPRRAAIEFLDSRTVEDTHFLDRRVTPVRRYENNPIIPDGCDVATVLKAEDGTVRMWYLSKVLVPGQKLHGGRIPVGYKLLRYAESEDGINWTYPELGLKEFEGTKQNNIIFTGLRGDATWVGQFVEADVDAAGRQVGADCIIDHNLTPAPHTRGRYTALFAHGTSFAYSDDGFTWTAYPENPVTSIYGSDTHNNFFFDTRLGRYVLFHRPDPRLHAGWSSANRLVARIESDDLIHWDWDSARCVLDTDGRDAPGATEGVDPTKVRGRAKQFYGMTVMQYQDFYIGFAQYLDETRNGSLDVHLLHSHDGIEWRREMPDQPLIPLPGYGHWDSGMLWTVPPVLVGDKLHFYYGASNMSHQYKMMNDERLDKRQIGLGTVRRGRLVGYHAGPAEGELLTRPFLLDKPQLLLNADAANGEIRAALAFSDGTPVPGCSKDDFEPLHEDGLDLPLRWNGKPDLSDLVGKSVRVRIAVQNGALYALRTAEVRPQPSSRDD
jgi:hypothetical protein